jgi:hypothetical protein
VYVVCLAADLLKSRNTLNKKLKRISPQLNTLSYSTETTTGELRNTDHCTITATPKSISTGTRNDPLKPGIPNTP